MKENVLISSQGQSLRKLNIILLVLGAIAVALVCIYVDVINNGYFERLMRREGLGDVILYILFWVRNIMVPIIVILAIINVVNIFSKMSLTVTENEIIGCTFWGRAVSLPIDSISVVGNIKLLDGISVATSAGKISFLLIKNADEVYNVINDLLKARQRGTRITHNATQNSVSVADELKKYKELLDMGVITQEEFDTKKNQLLGL